MNIITTTKKWEDILPAAEAKRLTNVLDDYRQQTQTPVDDKGLQASCSILFYGDSEKRKAAAALTGIYTGHAVQRIDTPAIISKYIGETEKNLRAIFVTAKEGGAILFFDEADSLFNKRTEVKDSHDKYANQEITYLLQQIEQHQNPVIVALNYKDQVASAILRSFHTVIHFPAAGKE
jgi:SpoVK/Ycf46/Vps4 family AAA+-type ATPase